MKKYIIILLLSISLLLTGCKKEEIEEPGIKAISNTSNDIIKDQKVDNFTFTNTSLIYQQGTSTLETTVTNISTDNEQIKEFHIKVIGKNNEIIITLIGYIGDSINSLESKTVISSCGLDLTKASRIEYEIIK